MPMHLENETSLLWHGPVWFAGRRSPFSVGQIPGLSSDIDLQQAFADGHLPVATLPSAILLDLSSVTAPVDTFASWLRAAIQQLSAEVPLIVLCGGEDAFPVGLKPHVAIDRDVSNTVLFSTICAQQRALMRFEEARIRRVIFGRIAGYGSAPHQTGGSGLLIVGLSGRFMELQQASRENVEVVGAFDQSMAEEYLASRAFDAVILDSTLDDTLENLRLIRLDSRYAALPVLVVTDHRDESTMLFEAGANDVLVAPLQADALRQRLAVAIRHGKRRRLSDKALAESHNWLLKQLSSGGVPQVTYTRYLEVAGSALAARGLDIWELKLLPESFAIPEKAAMLADDLFGTMLSVADATSREEDLVCVVHDIGPVAVLKSERGMTRLQSRINSILGHTTL